MNTPPNCEFDYGTDMEDVLKNYTDKDCNYLLLHQHRFPQVNIRLAVQILRGRSMASRKFPFLQSFPRFIYPAGLSLEQSSSEETARYKASLVHENDTVADLTGGMGIDAHFFAQRAKHLYYVEQQEQLCTYAQHNFAQLHDQNITICHASAEEFVEQMPEVTVCYIDPARRDPHERKVFQISHCTPNVLALQEILLAKVPRLLLKLSPMLDITLALQQLRHVHTVHVVGVGNECKELLFDLRATPPPPPQICVQNLAVAPPVAPFCFTISDEHSLDTPIADHVDRYLYEPHATMLKAGAFRSLAHHYGLKKLHQHTHLYTSDQLRQPFAGRVFEHQTTILMSRQTLRSLRQTYPKAHISVRNYPASVADIRKQTGIQDGGNVYLFFVTLSADHRAVLVCQKPTP